MIANLITLTNLYCGLYVIYCSEFDLFLSARLILLGTWLDCIDGGFARITRTTSSLGKLLDHIADFTTFGLAPVTLLLRYELQSLELDKANHFKDIYDNSDRLGIIFFVGIIWTISNLYREYGNCYRNNFYYGCPSPFITGIWSGGILVLQNFQVKFPLHLVPLFGQDYLFLESPF